MARSRQSNKEIEDRRLLVAKWMIRGVKSSYRIAELMGGEFSHDTIKRDMLAVEEEFRERFRVMGDIELARNIDIEKLDRAIVAMFPRTQNPQDKGQVSAARVMTEMIARKAAMLGYDAPQQTAQTIAGAIVATVVPAGDSFGERMTPEIQDAAYEALVAALPSGE